MRGIYINNGRMELDIPELLRAMDLPDTEENRDRVVEISERIFREQGIITESTNVQHTHIHRCVRCQTDWKHDGKRTKCILPKYAQCVNCKN